MEKLTHEQSHIPIEIRDKAALVDLLARMQVDTGAWGRAKGTKTVDALFKEISEGDSTLSVSDNKIIRTLSPLTAKVFYQSPEGDEYVLVEQHQVFLDPYRIKDRSHLPDAVGEKIKTEKGETVDEALVRAFKEELKVTGPFKSVLATSVDHVIKPSGTYPGLTSDETVHRFEVYLTNDQYRPEGYVEIQDDKVTCFTWIKR